MKHWKKGLPIVCFLLFVFFFFIVKVNAIAEELPLLGRVIFVDPGHGGRDPGAMYGKLEEKDIVLDISLKLRDALMEKGAIVYMTRDSDEDLSSQWDPLKKRGDLYRRILMYKKYNAELYLSIHINAGSSSSERGAEVLYHPINKNNKIFGEILMEQFKKNLNTDRKLITTDLYMYRNTTVPGVLIECGFITNPDERYLMQTEKYQKKLASTIRDAVIEYFR